MRLRSLIRLLVSAIWGLGVVCILPLSQKAFAVDALEPPALKIIWDTGTVVEKPAPDDGEIKDKKWNTFCGNMARALLAGKGPWGSGVFKSVSCYLGTKKIAGKDADDPWILRIIDSPSGFSMEISEGSGSELSVRSRLSLPASQWSKDFFNDRGFVDLVSLRLLNDLPFMGWLAKGLMDTQEYKTRGVYAPRLPATGNISVNAPEGLMVFSAIKTQGYVTPDLAGELTRVGVRSSPAGVEEPDSGSSPSGGHVSGSGRDDRPSSMILWRLDDRAVQARAKSGLWFHDARGSGQLVAELDQAIVAVTRTLSEAYEEDFFTRVKKGMVATRSSGALSTRYGVSALSDDPLFSKVSFFQFSAETRGGPLNGLQYVWDKMPAKSVTVDGVETKIEYSRHMIGRSFEKSFARGVDRVDIIPRLGLWAVKGELIDGYNADGTAATSGSYNMSRGYCAGLEAGLGWSSSWYFVRPWSAVDFATPLQTDTQKSALSARLGLDASWTKGPSFLWSGQQAQSALTAFFVYETMALAGIASDDSAASTEGRQTSRVLSAGFAGLGLAVSW